MLRTMKPYALFLALLFVLFMNPSCSKDKSALKKEPVFDPETVFTQANEKISKKYYDDAREILNSIKAQDASGKYAALAQIRIGDSFFEEGLFEEAAVEYEHFLSLHPYHKYAAYAQYQLGMSYFSRITTVDISYAPAKRALTEFEKLLTHYPRNPYVNVTGNRIEKCKSLLAEYEFYVGQFYFKKGSYTAAVQRFSNVLAEYPEAKIEPDALYYLGLSYKEMADRDRALKTLNVLVEKYPATDLSEEAKKLIASINKKKS